MLCQALTVSFQVHVISCFFLSHFVAPFTDAWTNNCKCVSVLFLTSAQGTPQISAGDNPILPWNSASVVSSISIPRIRFDYTNAMSLSYGTLTSSCLSAELPCCSKCPLDTPSALTRINLTTAPSFRHDSCWCMGKLCGAHRDRSALWDWCISGISDWLWMYCIVLPCGFLLANFQMKFKQPFQIDAPLCFIYFYPNTKLVWLHCWIYWFDPGDTWC